MDERKVSRPFSSIWAVYIKYIHITYRKKDIELNEQKSSISLRISFNIKK